MAGNLTPLFTSTKKTQRLTAYIPVSVRRYSEGKTVEKHNRLREDRAPSTAEEFLRVAEERTRKAEDDSGEARTGSAKEAQKEASEKGNFRKAE